MNELQLIRRFLAIASGRGRWRSYPMTMFGVSHDAHAREEVPLVLVGRVEDAYRQELDGLVALLNRAPDMLADAEALSQVRRPGSSVGVRRTAASVIAENAQLREALREVLDGDVAPGRLHGAEPGSTRRSAKATSIGMPIVAITASSSVASGAGSARRRRRGSRSCFAFSASRLPRPSSGPYQRPYFS
ncbi:MAG: hypothetical protein KF773_24640 [Deltaproteobacteria bacterium]|nr:hypothetical protein [Deltaproteobacteria bacterium]